MYHSVIFSFRWYDEEFGSDFMISCQTQNIGSCTNHCSSVQNLEIDVIYKSIHDR